MEINKRTAALAKEKPNRTRQYAINTPGYQNAGNKIYGNSPEHKRRHLQG
jgi:hypothetical protein